MNISITRKEPTEAAIEAGYQALAAHGIDVQFAPLYEEVRAALPDVFLAMLAAMFAGGATASTEN